MQTARVLGTTNATTKHSSLEGRRLVIVQPLLADGSPDTSPLIAIDPLGCRRGDRVMITSDGSHVREIVGHSHTPARWSVLGSLDDQD
ncbi:MAG: ethanolamine utilization protein EutN [Planctomycetaceae bacterium]|nr:MAG: ethanolamine utilization protein EutN [Planctomycetaceae bacterium]